MMIYQYDIWYFEVSTKYEVCCRVLSCNIISYHIVLVSYHCHMYVRATLWAMTLQLFFFFFLGGSYEAHRCNLLQVHSGCTVFWTVWSHISYEYIHRESWQVVFSRLDVPFDQNPPRSEEDSILPTSSCNCCTRHDVYQVLFSNVIRHTDRVRTATPPVSYHIYLPPSTLNSRNTEPIPAETLMRIQLPPPLAPPLDRRSPLRSIINWRPWAAFRRSPGAQSLSLSLALSIAPPLARRRFWPYEIRIAYLYERSLHFRTSSNLLGRVATFLF